MRRDLPDLRPGPSSVDWLTATVTFLLLIIGSATAAASIRTNRCYSCMSKGYEELFTQGQFSKYFFEPRNFTNQCDHPLDPHMVGYAPCRTICLTLIQDLVVMGRPSGRKLTMRGCSTSLSRFGFVNKTMALFDRYDMCREIRMSELFNYETNSQLVTVCSCLGDRCNGADNGALSGKRPGRLILALAIVFVLLHAHIMAF